MAAGEVVPAIGAELKAKAPCQPLATREARFSPFVRRPAVQDKLCCLIDHKQCSHLVDQSNAKATARTGRLARSGAAGSRANRGTACTIAALIAQNRSGATRRNQAVVATRLAPDRGNIPRRCKSHASSTTRMNSSRALSSVLICSNPRFDLTNVVSCRAFDFAGRGFTQRVRYARECRLEMDYE
jgi:hypothetical protein